MSEMTMECPACGAKQSFSGETTDLTCAYCGFRFTSAGAPVEPPEATLPEEQPVETPPEVPPAAQSVISPESETVSRSEPQPVPPLPPEEPKRRGWVFWVVIAVVVIVLVCICIGLILLFVARMMNNTLIG